MAELSGHNCDTCGKHRANNFMGMIPPGWYTVYPGFDNWKSFDFCSKKCLTTWVNGEAPVECPESKKVLFLKWIKAVFA